MDFTLQERDFRFVLCVLLAPMGSMDLVPHVLLDTLVLQANPLHASLVKRASTSPCVGRPAATLVLDKHTAAQAIRRAACVDGWIHRCHAPPLTFRLTKIVCG